MEVERVFIFVDFYCFEERVAFAFSPVNATQN